MKKLIMDDERTMCADIIKKQYKKLYNHNYSEKYKTVYFFGDNNIITDYLIHAIYLNNEKLPLFENIKYVNFPNNNYKVDADLEKVVATELDELDGKGLYFFFANCAEASKDYESKLELLKQLFEKMNNSDLSRCVITVLLPSLPDFSVNTHSFSEEQYDFYIRMCPYTPEIDYYIKLEKLCKIYSKKIT